MFYQYQTYKQLIYNNFRKGAIVSLPLFTNRHYLHIFTSDLNVHIQLEVILIFNSDLYLFVFRTVFNLHISQTMETKTIKIISSTNLYNNYKPMIRFKFITVK